MESGWRPVHRAAREPDHGNLDRAFRAELARRVPELDRRIGARDTEGASAILHQLIASSALCRQARLEQRLRSLDQACREPFSAQRLGQAWYSVISELRFYLEQD